MLLDTLKMQCYVAVLVSSEGREGINSPVRRLGDDEDGGNEEHNIVERGHEAIEHGSPCPTSGPTVVRYCYQMDYPKLFIEV